MPKRCAASVTAILLGWALACATAPGPVAPRDFGEAIQRHEPVLGPGTVFESIDDAAIDGLAWCYLESEGDVEPRVRGGAIHPIPGGYTYEGVVAAPNWHRERVLILVKPADVAYFIQIPSPGVREDEHHSRVHRGNVDKIDPIHRPSYLLTPRLSVQVYKGEGEEHQVAVLDAGELRELARRAKQAEAGSAR